MGLSKNQLMRNVKNIAVIGAGIVGLSTSYYLQSSGHKVTIFDKPKDETKITGNAATNEIADVSHISFNG